MQSAISLDVKEYFELLPGKVLDVQINHPISYRNKLLLVGYEIGKYIILKYPKTARANELSSVLIEGNMVIVRYLLEGASGKCYAFRASIKHIVQFPEKLIYLTYPEHLENRELRKQRRQITHIPASISLFNDNEFHENSPEHIHKGSALKGVVVDINAKGCGFTFHTANKKLTVNKRDVFINIQNPLGHIERIKGVVRNSRNKDGKVNVGIQFNDAEHQVSKLLKELQIDFDS